MTKNMNMVWCRVVGHDTTFRYAAQAGKLELNVMMTVILHNLLWPLTIVKNAVDTFTTRCVNGIMANRERCEDYAFKSASLVTALAPYIGYEASAAIAKEQIESGRDSRDIVRERILLPAGDPDG